DQLLINTTFTKPGIHFNWRLVRCVKEDGQRVILNRRDHRPADVFDLKQTQILASWRPYRYRVLDAIAPADIFDPKKSRKVYLLSALPPTDTYDPYFASKLQTEQPQNKASFDKTWLQERECRGISFKFNGEYFKYPTKQIVLVELDRNQGTTTIYLEHSTGTKVETFMTSLVTNFRLMRAVPKRAAKPIN
ncbi:hypothetical protein HY385_00210, partial [Candidatus Daviesbacteria bacterium]|nr:hypothetical protein [Candidatus Daviesbacteria bacterium]